MHPVSKRYQFSDTTIKNVAPESPGVFWLYSWYEPPAYIGSAETSLREALLNIWYGREGICKQNALTFAWEETDTPILRKRELLETFKKERNRLPTCNDEEG